MIFNVKEVYSSSPNICKENHWSQYLEKDEPNVRTIYNCTMDFILECKTSDHIMIIPFKGKSVWIRAQEYFKILDLGLDLNTIKKVEYIPGSTTCAPNETKVSQVLDGYRTIISM